MGAGLSPFVSEFALGRGGPPVGIAINGYLYINGPVIIPASSALIVQDQNTGAYYKIAIITQDGVGILTTEPVNYP